MFYDSCYKFCFINQLMFMYFCVHLTTVMAIGIVSNRHWIGLYGKNLTPTPLAPMH